MTSVIRVENLSFEYPSKRALNEVSFEIEAASVVALVGPNGAGKTTLLRCLAALEMPFEGKVSIADFDTARSPRECHRQLGYLSDFFGLYEELTTEQCLLHAGSMQGLVAAELERNIDAAINDLELQAYRKTKTGGLSRGLRQRVAIAQAILHSPKVLLLDEPASGLDPEARSRLAGLIRKLAAQGMTVVVSSHILVELEDYSTHMLTVEDGRILGFTSITGEAVNRDAANPLAKETGPTAGKRFRVQLAIPNALLKTLLESRPEVQIEEAGELQASFRLAGSVLQQAQLMKFLLENGCPVCSFSEIEQSMQEIYLAQLKQKREQEGVKS